MNAVMTFEDSVKERLKSIVADLIPEERLDGLGWIACVDRLPEEGVDVLAVVKNGPSVRLEVAGLFKGWKDCPAGWFAYENPEKELNVTHWMPLPKAPNAA